MNKAITATSSVLIALMTAIIITLPGCGGGSSTASGGGGGSGGTIAGTVDSGVALVRPTGRPERVFLALAGVHEARADGVAGVTVELVDGTGAVVATTTTDANGNFMFTGLAPGSYTIRLSQGGSVLGETPSVQVDSSTKTNLKLSLNGGVIAAEVESEGNQISGEVETSQDSSQDSSVGQEDSGDDNGATDDGHDDTGAGDDDGDDSDTTSDASSDDGEQDD